MKSSVRQWHEQWSSGRAVVRANGGASGGEMRARAVVQRREWRHEWQWSRELHRF